MEVVVTDYGPLWGLFVPQMSQLLPSLGRDTGCC